MKEMNQCIKGEEGGAGLAERADKRLGDYCYF